MFFVFLRLIPKIFLLKTHKKQYPQILPTLPLLFLHFQIVQVLLAFCIIQNKMKSKQIGYIYLNAGRLSSLSANPHFRGGQSTAWKWHPDRVVTS